MFRRSGNRTKTPNIFRRLGSRKQAGDALDSLVIESDEVPLMSVEPVSPAPTPVEIPANYSINRANAHFFEYPDIEYDARPFLFVRHDINAEDVVNVMRTDWEIEVPRIALFLISDIGPMGEWSQPRQLEAFKKGLMKAASTTHMWIFTNGLNIGIAKEIGDCIAEEVSRCRVKRSSYKQPRTIKTEKRPPVTLVGLAREDLLLNSDRFANSGNNANIQIEGNKPDDNQYELNPNHSHFIVIRDDSINKTGIMQFTLRFEREMAELGERDEDQTDNQNYQGDTTGSSAVSVHLPSIAVLVQGDFQSAKFVFNRLKKERPIIVLEGTGGLADLIAFGYDQIKRRGKNLWDAEFVEEFIKPEMAAMICSQQPVYQIEVRARIAYRDRVLEILRLACHQQRSSHLTVVCTRNQSCDLGKIDRIILKALFKSQRADKTIGYSQLRRDLKLTFDWNCPKVAQEEVFSKDPSDEIYVDSELFTKALLRDDREKFVDMFLERKFQLGLFLSKNKLRRIYQQVICEDFFFFVCWTGALGKAGFRVSSDFVENELNSLIEIFTGLPSYINGEKLTVAAAGMEDKKLAERRALFILVFWAVFTHRRKLTKILWKHSDQPVHLALLISTAYSRLKEYSRDECTRKELEESEKEFAEIATGVLDLSWQEDAVCRSYDMLSKSIPEFDDKTAVELAAQGKNMMFLAHPCCQKWITNLFYGRITIRHLSWERFVKIPKEFKVILSAFLLIPMYLFVRFKKHPHEMEYKPIDEYVDELDSKEKKPVEVAATTEQSETKARAMSLFRKQRLRYHETESFPSIIKMIYLMWSAPITKFWTFQISYMVYLFAFSWAVLLPSCGSQSLDTIVCSWTVLIILDSFIRCIQITVRMRSYTCVKLIFHWLEILLVSTMVGFYVWSRVLKNTYPLNPYNAKVLQCVMLIHAYYKHFVTYCPISSALGPLIYRIKPMVTHDFMNFMRMALLVMVSGGIVVQATMYPDHPWNWNLFRMTVYRAVFVLFVTPVREFGDFKTPSCSLIDKSEDACLAVGPYSSHLCPSSGIWTYLFSIQYLILLKIILMTLLFALFSNTARRIEADSGVIWKYQRYHLVKDFQRRLCLPPPFNVIIYAAKIVESVCCFVVQENKRCCCPKEKVDAEGLLALPVMPSAAPSKDTDFEYWRLVSRDYWKSCKEEGKEEKDKKIEMEHLRKVLDEIDTRCTTMNSLRAELKELHRLVKQSSNFLAEVDNSGAAPAATAEDIDGRTHFLSRNFQYPATDVLRYPVPKKYVPWDVVWMDYDPVVFTKTSDCFSKELQSFIDEDIIVLRSENKQPPNYCWNGVFVSPAGMPTDRVSWITQHDLPIAYSVEQPAGVPRNPYGRTGLRGKGGLCRWGPNHFVLFVITRWQPSRGHSTKSDGLEVVLLRATRGHYSLPGDFVPGEELYASLEKFFKGGEDKSLQHPKSKEGMLEFFKTFVKPESARPMTPTAEGDPPQVDEKLTVEVFKRGYMDDPHNTDNSWKEVELWNIHFHLGTKDNLSTYFDKALGWHSVVEELFPKIHPGQAALLSNVVRRIQSKKL